MVSLSRLHTSQLTSVSSSPAAVIAALLSLALAGCGSTTTNSEPATVTQTVTVSSGPSGATSSAPVAADSPTTQPSTAYKSTSDEELYGRLVADANALGIPGGATQIGTLAEGTCAVASGSMTKSDSDLLLRETAPLAWALLESWTQEQRDTFAALVIKDGYCGSTVSTTSTAITAPRAGAASRELPGSQALIITASEKVGCQVDVDHVSCQVAFNLDTPSRVPGSCGPANGVGFEPNGEWRWTCGDLGGGRKFTTVIEGTTYRAVGWTVVPVNGGLMITNDATGHGMLVDPDMVQPL